MVRPGPLRDMATVSGLHYIYDIVLLQFRYELCGTGAAWISTWNQEARRWLSGISVGVIKSQVFFPQICLTSGYAGCVSC